MHGEREFLFKGEYDARSRTLKIDPKQVGESWGMANDGEWRTPHFQQKWKRGQDENSLRQ